MESVNYKDIVVVVIMLVLGLRGLKNGLIHEIMSVIGLILGVYCASRYCDKAAHYLKLSGLNFSNETIFFVLAFILILSSFWIISLVLGVFISRFIILPELTIVNYCGGYIFAALKFFVILCIIVYGLAQVGFLKDPMKDFTNDMRSYPIMQEIAEKIMNLEALQNLQKQYMQQEEKTKK